eukprot:3816176-Lingulodinium_polyedra.AAC.1
MAGEPCLKAALVHILGDWAEIAHTWGFQDWSHELHPCFCCVAVRDDMDSVGNLSVVTGPWPAKTHAHYEEACRLCERRAVINDAVALA